MLARILSTLCLLSVECAAQSELPSDVVQLARIRQLMSSRLEHVPNYTCTEIVQRSEKRTGARAFQVLDTLRLNVAFADGKEIYSWPGAKRFENRDLGDVVGTGVSSSGEFISYARGVFLGRSTVIRFAGNETLRGRAAAKYDYRISSFQSGFTVRSHNAEGPAGMKGFFWVDAGTLDLLRLDVDAEEIPEYVSIAESHEEIDYGRVRLAANDVMIPEGVELTLIDREGLQKRNRVEFTACREYHTESAISFEPAGPMSGTNPAALQETALPAGLTLLVELDESINEGTASEGDLIAAHLTQDAVWKKRVLVPKGTIVKGRLRRLEKYTQPRPHYVVGFEFSEMEFEGKRASFTCFLSKIGGAAPATSLVTSRQTIRSSVTPAGIEIRTETSSQEILPGEIPGVGTFVLEGSHLRLEKGLRMEWRTE
jgi:hypothetical protein